VTLRRTLSAAGAPLLVEEEGEILHLTLARPRANILDREMLGAIRRAMVEHAPGRRAVILEGEGSSFSYGASVEEHRPEQAAAMLKELHGLLLDLMDPPAPLVAAVRGQCLGGALELVLCCSFVVAAPDAKFGQPEIKLGVFAPFASALLWSKVGLAHAERLLLTGRSIDAPTAQAIGLVDEVAADPTARAEGLVAEQILPLSGSSVRLALRAARLPIRAALEENLGRLERLYLDELMATHDGKEGIAAFLEKRAPRWEGR
jgi:cyclohexa-1,5-dienecarbonyl-CoA hydratase